MELKTRIGKQIESLLSQNKSVYGKITDKKLEDEYDLIFVDFTPNSLCQYRVYDIQNTEPIIICVSENVRPAVFPTREDFPMTAHLNIKDDGRKELCLFDLTYEELKSVLDGYFLLRQIDEWFCKTASNALHESTQPIEPYFAYPENTIVLSQKKDPIFYLHLCEVNGRNYYVQRSQQGNKNDFQVICIPVHITIETDNIIRPLPQTFKELSEFFPEYKLGEKIMKTIIEIETTAHDKNNLYKTQILLLLTITKTMKNQPERSGFEVRFALIKTSVGQMKGFLTNFENSLSDITIENYGYCDDFNADVAAMYNGIFNHPAKELKLLQIGVGAIGSQILNNCVKAGFGQWTFVDNDIFLTHNVARHKLDVDYPFGSYKSEV
jgi:hypothetical protein